MYNTVNLKRVASFTDDDDPEINTQIWRRGINLFYIYVFRPFEDKEEFEFYDKNDIETARDYELGIPYELWNKTLDKLETLFR